MKKLVLESWLLLLYIDFVMRFRDFKSLYRLVRDQGVRPALSIRQTTSAQICHAVDLACVFYFKQVLCLQRSAASTILLRRRGWAAEMVVGAQLLPFKSHAWVEINGTVANDKPYMLDIYCVLDRC